MKQTLKPTPAPRAYHKPAKKDWAFKPEQYHRHCDVYRIEVRYNEWKERGTVHFQKAYFYQMAAAERFARKHNGRIIRHA